MRVGALFAAEDAEVLFEILETVREAAARADWTRVISVIEWSGLSVPFNRGQLLGLSVSEIFERAAEFEKLSAAASQLLARARIAVGQP